MNMCSVLLRNELPARTYTTPAEELAVSCIDGSRACSRGRKNLLRRNSREALRHCLAFGLAVLFCCVPVMAKTPTETPTGTKPQNPCDKPDKGLTDTFKCLKHIYDKITQKEGLHLVTGSVVPQSGFAAGPGYTGTIVSEKWRIKFEASARISNRKDWEVDTNLRLTKSSNTFSSNNANGPSGDLKIDIYALVKDMQRLDFFGIGPESREQDRAVYHYHEGVLGADLSKPVHPSVDLGGAIEGILPNIVRISNPTVRSVERIYSEATAPGINREPDFLHLAAFAGLHSAGQPESRKVDYKFFYHFFQDLDNGHYSFRRFDADLKHKFPFGKNEVRIRGRLSFADTSAGKRVHFYLMQTLGGSNIRMDDTLRGFRDYRFRDRGLVLKPRRVSSILMF